jgi:2-phospho-L-lactate guanylyltransferase
MRHNWLVVVPVKVLAAAKSRLAGLDGLTDASRAELALAMAADTVAAASASEAVERVVVVTDDRGAAGELSAPGVLVLPDQPRNGLNAALAFGAAQAQRHWPGRGTAGLAADLPALSPAELSGALIAAARLPEAFVPDAAGTGTTLYTARPGTAFRPRFGPASRRAHAAGGAAELDLPVSSGLRRDVDTPGDLRAAIALGVGRRTAAAVHRLGLQPPRSGLLPCLPCAGSLYVHDRAGQRPGDPWHRLDLRDHEPAQVVDVFGLGPHDHVVRPGDIVGLGDAADVTDLLRDLGGLADLRLDEDVCVHHASSRGRFRHRNATVAG